MCAAHSHSGPVSEAPRAVLIGARGAAVQPSVPCADSRWVMWLDVIALLILGWFAWSGARRGALAAGFGLLGLVVAYAAAIVAGPALGPQVAERLGTSPVMGMPIAGTAAFALAFVSMALVSAFSNGHADPSDPRSPRDRFLGGTFGALRGAILVVLVSYLAMWVDALRVTGTAPPVPEVGGSTAAAVTGELVEAGIEAALADTGAGGRVVARIAARPAAALGDAMGVLENPQFSALRSDSLFWAHVESGSVDAALNQRSFLALAADAELRGQLAAIGVVDPAAAEDAGRFREAVGEVLRDLGPRLRGLRDDPELQALMEDPEVVAMVQSGNTLGLMSHPGFRDLVGKVAAR